jgi:glycosyltransferase involved in cell wall biosynthesis
MQFMNSPAVPGGAEEHVYSLVQALPPERFDVTIVCPAIAYDLFAPLQASGRLVFRLDLFQPTHFGAMKELIGILRKQRIEIAHAHQFLATLYLAPLAKLAGVRRVIETTHVREAWRKSWIKRSFLIDRFIYRFVDAFIAVSRANQEYLVEQKHCPAEKVTVVYNGRDLRRFQPTGGAGLALRRQWGIAVSDKLLVHVGRLEPQKGHAILLDAVEIVRRDVSNLKVLFVGDGGLRPMLEAEVERRRLRDVVIFAGSQTGVERFLDAADLAVLPSLWEGLPLVAIESAAMGKAMVATAVDGTPEVVLDQETGLLVPPGDSRKLAEAITFLLLDDVRRRQMGLAARRLAEQRFSIQKQADETAELYERLLGSRAQAGRLARAS